MVERAWVEAHGERQGRSWHPSATVYRVLDTPASYVRGFDTLQQEQVVLQYTDAHGQISRARAPTCAPSPRIRRATSCGGSSDAAR